MQFNKDEAKAETRRPKKDRSPCQLLDSGFGLRVSFGLRISSFGFSGAHSIHTATPAGGNIFDPISTLAPVGIGAVCSFEEKLLATQKPSRQSTKNWSSKFSVLTPARDNTTRSRSVSRSPASD